MGRHATHFVVILSFDRKPIDLWRLRKMKLLNLFLYVQILLLLQGGPSLCHVNSFILHDIISTTSTSSSLSFDNNHQQRKRKSFANNQAFCLKMAKINNNTNNRRPSSSSSSSSLSSSSRWLLPKIFPGQSLAHNFHEFVLGVLIDSNGQNVLPKQSLSLTSTEYNNNNNKYLPPHQQQSFSSSSSQRKRRRRSISSPLPQQKQQQQQRIVTKIERFERIPTWPTRNGLRFRAISRMINNNKLSDLAARLEHQYGGADCPNLWLRIAKQTSPFLMMCHHNHSFDLKDPIRLLEKKIIPEGFPSHAHRGMTTVTICLRGGLIHRDSLGNKQIFGATDNKRRQHRQQTSDNPYKGQHTQWLTFGKGLVHELMWDNQPTRRGQYGRRDSDTVIHQEIYQIWIDLPQAKRYINPRVELLGGFEDDTPLVVSDDTKKNGKRTRTQIIAGSYDGVSASVDTISELTILRVEMDSPYSSWTHEPPSSHKTIIIYVRTGSITIGGNNNSSTRVPPHCTAYLSTVGDIITVKSGGDTTGADFLVMSGEPLNQEVVARGSMVAETSKELEQAFLDYEKGEMGVPWNEHSSDAEWRRHIKKTKDAMQ